MQYLGTTLCPKGLQTFIRYIETYCAYSMILIPNLKLKHCWQIKILSVGCTYMQDHLLSSNPFSVSVPKQPPLKVWLQLKTTSAWTSWMSSTFQRDMTFSRLCTTLWCRLWISIAYKYCRQPFIFIKNKIKTDLWLIMSKLFNHLFLCMLWTSETVGHQHHAKSDNTLLLTFITYWCPEDFNWIWEAFNFRALSGSSSHLHSYSLTPQLLLGIVGWLCPFSQYKPL